MFGRLVAIALLTFIGTAHAAPPVVLGDEEAGELVHYAYSTLLGTGVYQLDDRTVYVLRAPLSRELRPPSEDRPGLKLLLPVTIGLHDFDFKEIDKLLDAKIGTITALPGLELDYRPDPRWSVRPSVYAGIGFDATNRESSFIYAGALRSTYRLRAWNPKIDIGMEGLLSGYSPEKGPSRFLTRIGLGLDTIFPTDWELGKGHMFVNPQLIGYAYLNEMRFASIGREDIRVRAEFQAGLAIGRDPPVEILGFPVERVGLAYRRGPHIDAVVFIYNFPF